MIQFLHLSDLHFHRRHKDNVAIDQLLDGVASAYPGHHVILTGDVTDDGDEAQYVNALAALERFRGRLWLVPGNHDYGPLGNFYSDECASRFDRFLSMPFAQGITFGEGSVPSVNVVATESERVVLIGLDSNLRTADPFDWACGQIGEQQRAMLTDILSWSEYGDSVKIVYLHHHPFVHSTTLKLLDGDAFIRTVFGKADIVAFGHKHVAGLWRGLAGTQWIVAAENSPGRLTVREISIERNKAAVRDMPVFSKSVAVTSSAL